MRLDSPVVNIGLLRDFLLNLTNSLSFGRPNTYMYCHSQRLGPRFGDKQIRPTNSLLGDRCNKCMFKHRHNPSL